MAAALVLLADVDVAAMGSAQAALSAAGYACDQAVNGQRALKQITARPPDVLITEILMPDGDGIELIAAVKLAHPNLRIVGVTGRRWMGRLDLLYLASMLGADAVLDKPFETARLLAIVAQLVGS